MKRFMGAVVGLVVAGMVTAANAATILTGDVSYDNVTGLYTYNYMLDNPGMFSLCTLYGKWQMPNRIEWRCHDDGAILTV